MENLECVGKFEYLIQQLHMISLPNTLWAIHLDPKYNFIGILHMNLISFENITIDKAVILTFEEALITKRIYMNNCSVHIPELDYPLSNITDISQLVYLLDEIKVCSNAHNVNITECKKYIYTWENKENNYCSNCVSDKVNSCTELRKSEFFTGDYNEYIDHIKLIDYALKDGIDINQANSGKDENTSKTFGCKHCNKKFTSKIQLDEHTRLHTGEKPYQCEICNKTNTHRSSHHKHMLTHSEFKPFLCNICGKSFYKKYRLEDHMVTHNPDPKHECQICFKKFATSNNLKIHHRIHTGDRPYVCTICNKTYTTPSNLSTHVKSTHSDQKPHVCGICDKAFVHPRLLRIHMRKHTGEKPYKCTTCAKTFSKNIHLTVHIRTHTGERPYVCTICAKTFTTTGNLSSHKRVHHKNIENVENGVR